MPDPVEIRTDPHLTSQDGNSATPTDAKRLHDWPETLPTIGESVVVAIMDSGIHPDLFDSHPWFKHTTLGKQYDATGNGTGNDVVGHGSACASVYGVGAASLIASQTDDSTPVEFYDARIFGDNGSTSFSTIRDAYSWLLDHADEIDIVNMSWGARKDVPQINQLHEKLVDKGVHDIVAAGNTGSEGGSPSTSKAAFSAGAVDKNGDLTRFTSRDPDQDNPDVAALGKNTKLARAPGTSMGSPINEQFTAASGTSFAAPWTGAAYTLALYAQKQGYDAAFEKAAPDIPGSKADGEGLLKTAPVVPDKTPPEQPPEQPDDPDKPTNPPEASGAMKVGQHPFIGEWALTDGDILPSGNYDVTAQKNGDGWTLTARPQ